MYTGSTLENLVQRLGYEKSVRKDLVASTARLTLSDGDQAMRLAVDEHDHYRIAPYAHGQIRQHLDIPGRFYSRLLEDHRGLLATNVNELFRYQPVNRMVRTLEGRVRAFLSDRYRCIDNDAVLLQALEALSDLQDAGRQFKIASCEATERRLYLKVIFHELEREVSEGDVVQAGLLLQNSEIGDGTVNVQPFARRCVCDNGLVIADNTLTQRHVGRRIQESGDLAREIYGQDTIEADDRAFFLKMRDTIRSACDETMFDRTVENMRISTRQRVSASPVDAVRVLANRFQVSVSERDRILTRFFEGGMNTRWGLVNAVTEASKEAHSYDRATELEVVGGKLLSLPQADWQTIAEAQSEVR